MSTTNAERSKRHARRQLEAGATRVSVWLDPDQSKLMEKHRGTTPKTTFIRAILDEYLAWREHFADQMDLMAYLAIPEPEKKEMRKSLKKRA